MSLDGFSYFYRAATADCLEDLPVSNQDEKGHGSNIVSLADIGELLGIRWTPMRLQEVQ